jgi:uncharacterized repeat protein (TIGR01451 family)
MTHAREASVAPTQAAPTPLTSLGNLARHWLTEEAGDLLLKQLGNPKLRLPLYVNSRPASTMSAPATIPTGGNPTGSTTLPLSGTDFCTGTLGAGPTCTGSFPNDEMPLVTPFELQVVHPRDTTLPPEGNIQYAGVAYDPATNLILFGISTWGDWTSPRQTAFNIYIDSNSDGVWDRILFNSDPGTMGSRLFGGTSTGQDAFVDSIFNLATSGVSIGGAGLFVNRASPAVLETALLNNNVMLLAATPAQLGLAVGTTSFRWRIETCPGFAPLCSPLNGFHFDAANGPYSWNYAAASQGLNFVGTTLAEDLNGASLPVSWNSANMTANGSLGALLLHHHNKSGQRAQVLTLGGAPTADLSIAKSASPPAPTFGQNVTFTVTVNNNSATGATGVVVTDLLPTGLTYVSDDGGGAYDSGSGQWTVGSLAGTASATLHIVATVATTQQVCNVAQITARSPLDPNPANDQSQICILAPRSGDVAVGMTVSAPNVLVGVPVTYTITVTNGGDDTSYSLSTQEAFPAYPLLNPTSFTASAGSFSPSTGLWNVGSLAKGASETLAISLSAPNIAGALTDQATATSAATNDPNNANNTASATTTVLSPSVVTATKKVSGTFLEGGTITYTIELTNSAAYDQQDNPGHEFTDTLPSTVTVTGTSASSGTAASAGNTVTWDGKVPAGGSVTVTITATINAGTAGSTITNQGTANYDSAGDGTNKSQTLTDDPAVGGASDPTSFTVLSPATISGTKTASGPFVPGGGITYTVILHNSGTFTQLDNPGPEFTDVLPSELVLVSAVASSGTSTATVATNTVTWNGSIAAGASVTLTIAATIKSDAGGQTITNQGAINFDADGNGTNESSTVTDDPGLPGNADPTSFAVASVAQIPTLDEVGLGVLLCALAGAAFFVLRRRRA